MASSYTRNDSPFVWLRLKRPDGTWQGINSGIRVDDPDSARKIKMRLAKEGVVEAAASASGHTARFESWVPAFLSRHYANTLSLERAQNAWAALAVFLDWKGLLVPSQITHNSGHEYVEWRQHPPKKCRVKARAKNTALLEVKILSVIMQEAVRRQWAAGNPLLRLGIRRDAPKEKQEITQDSLALIEASLKHEPQWMQDCWLVAMRQGCRLRAAAVPMDRIDEGVMSIVFRNKGGKLYAAPLHPDLLGLVARRRAEGAEVLVDLPKMPSKAWHSFFKRLGMEGRISFHSTRVTVITKFARAGVVMAQAMSYVGHASATVHRIYQKLQPPDVGHLGKLLGP